MKNKFVSRSGVLSALLWAAFVPAALAADCGCGVPHAPDNTPATPIADTKGSTVVITEADKDKTIALKAGDRLQVRLESNPTTGFEWVLAYTNHDVLPSAGDSKFETPKDDTQGAPTMQILSFDAKAAGTVKLALQYKRPWEKDSAPAKTFGATIKVSE